MYERHHRSLSIVLTPLADVIGRILLSAVVPTRPSVGIGSTFSVRLTFALLLPTVGEITVAPGQESAPRPAPTPAWAFTPSQGQGCRLGDLTTSLLLLLPVAFFLICPTFSCCFFLPSLLPHSWTSAAFANLLHSS